jgi:ABC-type branched-subunit amino acid transport system ATPase component/ABC-type branched-subunit amino acid transport system permease subunit
VTTLAELAGAAREVQAAWNLRTTVAVAAFAVAALAPLVFATDRVADLATGLYLAAAATGLAFGVGVGGLPSLAQGAFVAVGAVTGTHLAGTSTLLAAIAGALAAAAAALAVALVCVRLPAAGFAAATWIVAWLVSLGLTSLGWFLGGTEGRVVPEGLSPAGHYELALALTALAALAFASLRRSPFGLRLAAARDREAAAAALGFPVRRLRVTAATLGALPAGAAGALAVQLAGIGDPAQYGPYLSFKLFAIVLIGGAAAPLGATAGTIVLALLSVAADAIGSLENVASSRSHALLAAVLLLAVVSLGWNGLVRPGRQRGRPAAPLRLPEPPPAPLTAEALGKRYGEVVAADAVSFAVEPGTVTVLVGPNGSGKTSILRLLAGAVPPDAGRVQHGGVARTLQATATFGSLTAVEHLLAAGAARRRHGGLLRSLLQTPKARAEDAGAAAHARAVLARWELPADVPAAELPVAAQRVLMLLAAAATGAPILLVDEPTAGASPREAARAADVIRALRDAGHGLLVVEHNLDVVRTIADRVIALDAGRIVDTSA